MRFFALTAALAIGASALPTEQSEAVSIATVQNIPATPSLKGLKTLVIPGNSKREVELEKRATAVIDFYFDLDGTGNHVQISASTGVCYTFNSAWNDQVTSLRLSAGVTCTFAGGPNCGASERRLVVQGPNYAPDLRVYGMDDIITSFSCT